jgi:hypothetical protein
MHKLQERGLLCRRMWKERMMTGNSDSERKVYQQEELFDPGTPEPLIII